MPTVAKSYGKVFVLGAASIFFFCLSARAQKTADFISTPSELGSKDFHHHLVRPGAVTSYILRVQNIWDRTVDIRLGVEAAGNNLWAIDLSKNELSAVKPGKYREVLVTVRASGELQPKEPLQFKITAHSSNGFEDENALFAETSASRKIYFVSLDSLHPDYLNLNSAGTGLGKQGDWLMPNAQRVLSRGVFYPNAKVHIPSASDNNHFNMLAGTMTRNSGIPHINFFFYGFDEKGKVIIRSDYDPKSPVTFYDEGKATPSLFNAAKFYNPQAWTAYVSGAEQVVRVIDFPQARIDRVVYGDKRPDWILSPAAGLIKRNIFYKNTLKPLLPDPLPYRHHPVGNPAGLREEQDPRQKYPLAVVMSDSHAKFPPDRWTMDAALLEILNEDPDLLYILLAQADDAGHCFGSAWDLTEWNGRGTETVRDDISKYDPRASRQGILNVVREADNQLGRFLDFMQQRGMLDQIILVLESDHSQVTHFRKALTMGAHLNKATKLSAKKDYFFASILTNGFVAARRDDPSIIPELERALESWQVKNPLTGDQECPVIVYNREEMKTGLDQATGQRWLLPGEYYSEYYIERRKPEDQIWPELLVVTKSHYKFKIENLNLADLEISNSPIKIPRWGYFIGGHGNFTTRPSTLIISAPGVNPEIRDDMVFAMDIAPTILRIQGWAIPDSVDGIGLPGADPEIKSLNRK